MVTRRYATTCFFGLGLFLVAYGASVIDTVLVLFHYHPPSDRTPLGLLSAVADDVWWPAAIALVCSAAFLVGETLLRLKLRNWVAMASALLLLAVPFLVGHAGLALLGMIVMALALPLLAFVPSLRHTDSLLSELPPLRRAALPLAGGISVLLGIFFWVVFPTSSCLLLNYSDASSLRDVADRMERFRSERGRLPSPDSDADLIALGFGKEMRPGIFLVGTEDYEIMYLGFDGPVVVYKSQEKGFKCIP